VRTAVRTLLAEVHGDQDAAREQIDIALSTAAPSEVAAVVMQALRWTIRLATECTNRDLPVAGWIEEALDTDEN
jgi:phosphoserine phosphatase